MQNFYIKNIGFTLVELIITLAVAAILLSLAAPSFVDIIKDNRQVTQINDLASSLNLARSEAIKRSLPVTVCRSNDSATCSGNWQDGWIVFVDIDADGAVDTTDIPPDTIIRVHGALSNGNTLKYGTNRTRITYSSDGFAVGFNATFTLCDNRKEAYAKGLVVSPTGRVRVAIDTDTPHDGITNTGTINMVCP